MTKKMLIDATHAEETRVAVVDSHGGGNRMEEFDYESKFRKPLKGSIFLAKVTRVEPSLQAAFVNFGGNRHGFLPFSEIHPDYFRIPVADREALIAEQEAELAAHDEEDEKEEEELEAKANDESADDASDDDDLDDDEDVIEEVGGNVAGDKPAAKKKAAAKKKPAAKKKEPAKKAEPKKKTAAKKATNKDIEPEDLIPEDEAVEEASEDKGAKKPAKKAAKKTTKAAKVPKNSSDEIVDDSKGEPNGNVKPKDAAEIPDEVVDAQNDGNKDPSESGNEKEGNTRGNRGGRGRGRGRGGRGGRNNNRGGRGGRGGRNNASRDSRKVEILGGTEYDDEGGNDRFRYNLRRKYKIQEVIKRGQIMLVQASKEERGNKGAAVTSYLSLPGRYCVLMPNSPRAGGVSRKIADYKDRNRMRDIIKSLDIPKGMSVIVRTAGVARTKAEIKRDLDYLLRLWNNIRELTLQSSAPALVYEEADLIKRSVRDLYTRDVEQIIVAGESGFKNAKNFMKMLIPSHAKKVVEYKDTDMPLFNRYKVEDQITEIGEPNARLKSGGYLVINPTEALVSIDVNSGRATKERHIEGTALNTNLEAADEVARQLRLRDLGGLVVIDFIDMEDRRNNRKVEQRLKEALSGDRARIQIGRISSFGLLEMSRQRMNPSLTEAQYEPCKNCDGKGRVRSADATSVMLLRSLEEEGMKKRAAALIVHVSPSVAIYLLNNKREKLAEIEDRYGFTVLIRVDDDATQDGYRIEVSKPSGNQQSNDDSNDNNRNDEQGDGGKKRSRRGGRGRRGGRNRNRDRDENNQSDQQNNNQGDNAESAEKSDAQAAPEKSADDAPKKPSRGRGRKVEAKEEAPADNVEAPVSEAKPEVVEEAPKKAPAKPKSVKKAEVEPAAEAPKEEPKKDDAPKDYETVNEPPKKKKKGWWSRG